jgi:hypothetical protein
VEIVIDVSNAPSLEAAEVLEFFTISTRNLLAAEAGARESYSERPGDRHGVSANASAIEPARLLAVFVVDTELTIPFGQ